MLYIIPAAGGPVNNPCVAGDRPEIVMPPLSPPAECAPHLEQRADDTEPVIKKRLQVRTRSLSFVFV